MNAVRRVLHATERGLKLVDERGRKMEFPRRQDYIAQLQKHGLVRDEAQFITSDDLTEAVYLDWLLRPQVGCVFAQLLARPIHRSGVRTTVARGSSGSGMPSEVAVEITKLVNECVNDPSVEALSILLPQITDVETLTYFVWELSKQPGWIVDREHLWRKTVVLVGLRVDIGEGVVAETLGMGPFDIFPTTRQCPITSLEIRTKTRRAKRSHCSRDYLAAHLAQVNVDHALTKPEFGSRFKVFTPWLKKRILGGDGKDLRAKAGVTYSVPAAIWGPLKTSKPSHIQVAD